MKNTKLKDRRRELGLTLRDVAASVGVSASTVLRWEKGEIGNMKRNYIQAYANTLKVSPLFIMSDELYSPPKSNRPQTPLVAELLKLSTLYQNGFLSAEEYEISKKYVLEQMKNENI